MDFLVIFIQIRSRDPSSRWDRYMLLTFEDPPSNVKVSRQNEAFVDNRSIIFLFRLSLEIFIFKVVNGNCVILFQSDVSLKFVRDKFSSSSFAIFSFFCRDAFWEEMTFLKSRLC